MRFLKTAIGEVLGLAISPSGDALAAAVEDQGVFLWNLQSPGSTPVVLDTTATYRARDLYFSPDGRSIGWLAWEGWKIYDRDTRSRVRQELDARGQIFSLVASPNADRVYSQHNIKGPALIAWQQVENGWEREWEISTEHLSIQRLTVGPDGKQIAMLTRKTSDGKWWERPSCLEIRSAGSGVVQGTASYQYSENCPISFSPDGNHIVGVHEMTLLIWSLSNSSENEILQDFGEPLLIRNDSRKHFTAAAFHPSGQYLLAASNDGSCHVFETAGWSRVSRYSWKTGRLRSLTLSADGSLAAAGCDRGEIVLWDLDL